jgi:acyl-CoA thioester hydrolase
MIIHEFQKRVRYGETDQMGYLYYGHYAQYYEIGRVEMLRAQGLTYKEMEQVRGVLMPVVSLQMRFVRPAYYDELLTIRTVMRRLPDKFITFEVEILNENRKLVNGGTVRLCFVEADSRKTISAPEFLLEKLKMRFETSSPAQP